MKLHKVVVWHKRKLYYVLGTYFRLNATWIGDGLSKTYLDTTKLQERLKECTLVQKQQTIN